MLNITEYKILKKTSLEKIKNFFSVDELTDSHYIEYYNYEYENLTECEKIRVNTKNVSEFLIKITDKSKYTNEEIFKNLKNCLYNRDACLFSCGNNINEHSEHFKELLNCEIMTKCCIKSSCAFLNYNCDIICVGNNINNYIDNYINMTQHIFKVLFNNYNYTINNFLNITTSKKCHFLNEDDNIYFENNNIYVDNFQNNTIFQYILFLKHVGITNIYLFGCFINDNFINIQNYNYYDDILINKGHFYDNLKDRIMEPGSFIEQINSYYLYDWAIKNNIKIYNVSKKGCFSNKIKRISFDSIFSENKQFISSENDYVDFMEQYKLYFDEIYYTHKYNTPNPLFHYITNGIYKYNKINKNDNKQSIEIDDFMKNIICLVSYVNGHLYFKESNNINCISPFFSHYLIKFNKKFKVCFYNDYTKINNENFFDSNVLKYKKNIETMIVDCEKYKLNNNYFNENKYFKLMYYIFLMC